MRCFPARAEQKSMLDAVSQLGVLLLLLLTGMETDLQLVKRVGRAAVTVSIAGVALPFAGGFALGEMLPAALLPRPGRTAGHGDFSWHRAVDFFGEDRGDGGARNEFHAPRSRPDHRRVGDSRGHDRLGHHCGRVRACVRGQLDVWSVGRAVLGTALFMAASLTIGRRIVFNLIRWTNDNFESEFPVITTILVIMIAMALTTQLIGVNTVLGAFVAGILIGESPILTRHINEQLRGLISALFMPVFFGLSGLNADLTALKSPTRAARRRADPYRQLRKILRCVRRRQARRVEPRGIVGARLRHECARFDGSDRRFDRPVDGRPQPELFTVIVAMAILTTTAMPPMLRWSLKRLPMRKKERLRLEREELDAKGFVTNLERLLLAADDSPNGKFASRLAGVIAGSGGKPTTVVDMSKEDRGNRNGKAEARKARGQIRRDRRGEGKRKTISRGGRARRRAIDHTGSTPR